MMMKKTYEAPTLKGKAVIGEPTMRINSVVKTQDEYKITDEEKILVRENDVWGEEEEEE